MSFVGEALLKRLVAWKENSLGKSHGSRSSGGFEDYFRWQFESSPRLFSHYPKLSLAGKRVLEIGCGTGGRTAWLASQDTAETVGIDINAPEIGLARDLQHRLYPHLDGRVTYFASKENEALPFDPFDIVMLVDSMEHVVSPPAILKLAWQYTKPGGVCYFNTMGWYHYSGSHTGLLPWVNVLFSDETILNVIRWRVTQPGYRPTRFDSDPPIDRWLGIYNLRDRPGEHLNKITLREIRKLVRYSRFHNGTVTVIPFQPRNLPLRLMNLLGRVPGLDELFHSGVVARMER
jgi:2-polyprenyl-3-methyl-5-hydroxy-6-metoxy-1,4-benzoquinol methylase